MNFDPADDSPPPSPKAEQGAFLTGIPGYIATLGLGGIALGCAAAAYLPAVSILAYVDLPLAMICLLASGIIGLGSRRNPGLVLGGVLMGALGVVLAALHLLFFHDHPWLS